MLVWCQSPEAAEGRKPGDLRVPDKGKAAARRRRAEGGSAHRRQPRANLSGCRAVMRKAPGLSGLAIKRTGLRSRVLPKGQASGGGRLFALCEPNVKSYRSRACRGYPGREANRAAAEYRASEPQKKSGPIERSIAIKSAVPLADEGDSRGLRIGLDEPGPVSTAGRCGGGRSETGGCPEGRPEGRIGTALQARAEVPAAAERRQEARGAARDARKEGRECIFRAGMYAGPRKRQIGPKDEEAAIRERKPRGDRSPGPDLRIRWALVEQETNGKAKRPLIPRVAGFRAETTEDLHRRH